MTIRENAGKKGLRINTVKASYDTFDYGTDKWDLIVMTYAWAPVSDPAFVRKIQASLRKGGKVVFERLDAGRIVADGSPEELMRSTRRKSLEHVFRALTSDDNQAEIAKAFVDAVSRK